MPAHETASHTTPDTNPFDPTTHDALPAQQSCHPSQPRFHPQTES